MKIQHLGRTASIALIGSLALAGCGSDSSSSSTEAAGADGFSATADCFSGTLDGEGSSAQKNAIEEVIAAYGENCPDATINYNPTGSGAGITQFIGGQVDFAGSDSALRTQEKDGRVEAEDAAAFCGSPAWNIPMVTGPIAVSYNLPGVDRLALNPAVIADIFSGAVTSWDDPAIAALNEGATLPDLATRVFFRSDESGTTENFSRYLAGAAAEKWTDEPGKRWTGTGEGKEKSSGVAEGVKSTEGGVTYVEWSYAKDNDLGIAEVDNGAGAVELTGESVGKAVAAAEQEGSGNDLRLELDYATREPGAYPILLVTYEIVCSKGKDATTQSNIKRLLTYFADPLTQTSLEEIGYAPLPEEVQAKVETAIAAIS